MNLRRIGAMARKETLHVIRDPRSIGMGIAIPVILLFLFGYALSLDVEDVPLIVWDQSGTALSREFTQEFIGSRYFKFVRPARSYRDVVLSIDTRQALAGLVIPRDFAAQVDAAQPVRVQWIVDGSDSNTASIATGYAKRVSQSYSQKLVLEEMQRHFSRPFLPPLDLRARVWFNADLESRNYIVPGLIAVIMMVIAALLTSLTVAREWETGTMEQLISTPVKSHEMYIGKLIPYFAIGMFDVLIAVLMGEFLFHVPLRGSVPLLFAMAGTFLLGALSMGLLISIATRKQLLANQVALLATFVPAFLLSGFAFPIENMPPVVQGITYLVPARFLVTILKNIYLKGTGLEVFFPEFVFLVIFTLAMAGLSIKLLRRKLD